MWDLSCVDWADRIRAGRSLIPTLPLFEDEASIGLQFFDELQLPDVPKAPKLRTAAGQWFRDIARTACGSWDPVNEIQYIRDILAMVPKGQSKTSYGAGLAMTKMLMNRRPRAEAMFIGPTQAISDRAYEQSVGMIDESKDLKRRFRPRDHKKTIEDLVTRSELTVKTFDVNIVTGSILFFALLDEIHLLGRNPHAAKVLRQIRGGLEKTPEGQLLITTTQSDEIPAGVFKEELKTARKIRDGKYRDRDHRPMLPILYEFPIEIAKDEDQWQDPANWQMVMPNLGRSVHLDSLKRDWETERDKGEQAIKIWASQHLNIEIGVGITSDGWIGAELWEQAVDPSLTLESLLARSEVITFGADGGGLDDLMGIAVIGRERGTRQWLSWCHAFADPKVLERRQEIAPQLKDFVAEKTVTIEGTKKRQAALVDLLKQIVSSGLMPDEDAVGIDPNNAAALFEALAEAGVEEKQIRRLLQGRALQPGLFGLELKLDDGTLTHADQLLMNWVVGNAKVEPLGNYLIVTKQISGRAKIDPFIALMQAAILMSWNPEASSVDLSDFLKNVVTA